MTLNTSGSQSRNIVAENLRKPKQTLRTSLRASHFNSTGSEFTLYAFMWYPAVSRLQEKRLSNSNLPAVAVHISTVLTMGHGRRTGLKTSGAHHLSLRRPTVPAAIFGAVRSDALLNHPQRQITSIDAQNANRQLHLLISIPLTHGMAGRHGSYRDEQQEGNVSRC